MCRQPFAPTSVVVRFEMTGAALVLMMLYVIVMFCGLFVATGDEIGTVAVYVPGANAVLLG